MRKYEILTKYIPIIRQDTFREWHVDTKNEGTEEHPYGVPYVEYRKIVRNLERDIYAFDENNMDYNLKNYGEILKRNGIEWGMKSMEMAEVDKMDAQTVLALLMGAVRAERFCDGALLRFLEQGNLLKWLERLQDIDENG